jgi:hypothetical protein
MKITKIEKDKDKYNIYCVTLAPNFIEKFFGVKERVEKFKDTGSEYWSGGGIVYVNQDGEHLGNGSSIGEAIDKWRRRF